MEKFNKGSIPPRILISPLDWGLGHTTRCIPLIHKWLAAGYEVSVACNEFQQSVLKKEFPSLKYYSLPGYAIEYGKTGLSTYWKLLCQIPKILRSIKNEHQWLQQHLLLHPADYIISDNRYGFFTREVKSIFITHQLAPRTQLGRGMDYLLSWRICAWINRFKECWIPDLPEHPLLSGRLSVPVKPLNIPVKYIGGISRFKTCKPEKTGTPYILVILSGPEPQRSLLEMKIVQDAVNSPLPIQLVRGSSAPSTIDWNLTNLKCIDIADTDSLQLLICNADLVISRAGYTSILDYATLHPKAVLVPTPGQSEQQYLAYHLQEQKIAPFLEQHAFSIQAAIEIARDFPYHWPSAVNARNEDLTLEG